MVINFQSEVYAPVYAVFARTVTITPLASQPNVAPYAARGIYDTRDINIETESTALFDDAVKILDILQSDFTVVPVQGDRIFIPASGGMPEVGTFEVIDIDDNGGGEITLALRRIVIAKP